MSMAIFIHLYDSLDSALHCQPQFSNLFAFILLFEFSTKVNY